MFFEPCSEKAACLSSVSLVATLTWDLVDDFAPLKGWDGVFNVNQVGSHGKVGLVGNLDIVGVESSSYGLPPLNSVYINDRQPHYLLFSSITPPEDDLQQQIRKCVTKNPCPDEAFYLQIFYSGCPSTRLFASYN